MILDKAASILYFEDDKISQNMMTSRLKLKFGAKITIESTLKNLDIYIRTQYINEFDLIICDYCFTGEDISPKLQYLAAIDKRVVFNTCLDYDDWQRRVIEQLGEIPNNFVYTRKADYSGLLKIDYEVERASCDY